MLNWSCCYAWVSHICFAANIKNFSTVKLTCSLKLFVVPAGAPILSHYYYTRRPNLCRQLRTAPYGQDPWWHMLNYFIFQFFKFNMSLLLSLHAIYSLIQKATCTSWSPATPLCMITQPLDNSTLQPVKVSFLGDLCVRSDKISSVRFLYIWVPKI